MDRRLLDALVDAGASRGVPVGLTLATAHSAIGFAVHGREQSVLASRIDGDIAALVGSAEEELRPRWVMWSQETAAELVHRSVRVAVAWDLTVVHRLLHGEWQVDLDRIWSRAHQLGRPSRLEPGSLDLFGVTGAGSSIAGAIPVDALASDGQLDADWVAQGWGAAPARLARWAGLALEVAGLQRRALESLHDHPFALATARAESVAELLCAELTADGLPLDRTTAESLIAEFVGPRPVDAADAARRRDERDHTVLRHAPPGTRFLLRNPAHVKALLQASGVDVADTRAWTLESRRDRHPVVGALLAWRKAERIDTTFGYAWLDEHVGSDGRLRGAWSASDGAAGRMTATAGLHNMPAELRSAVAAEPGMVLVRADLGQIEPRVLAAVSGDRALAAATEEDDLYLPVATAIGVDRATAKVAVLGAMYGQTTGHGAVALQRLDAAYPTAMGLLREAAASGQVGRDVRTWGGRLVRLGPVDDPERSEPDVPVRDDREARARAAARGRYARNATIQGAAAELFKVWAVTVRARGAALGAEIVLCLHDELLVHAPAERADEVAGLLHDCLAEAAHHWGARDGRVRFVVDVSVVGRWSDAKEASRLVGEEASRLVGEEASRLVSTGNPSGVDDGAVDTVTLALDD